MGEILEAMLKGVLELVFEILIKGPGYLLWKWLRPDSETDPDGCLSIVCGVLFWAIVVLAIWAVAAIFQK